MIRGRPHEAPDEAFLIDAQRSFSVEPSNPLLRSIRALLLFYGGDFEQAVSLLQEVLAQHPNLHGVRPLLAMCLTAQGEPAAALAELNDDVRRTASVDPDIAYGVASVYAEQGLLDDAFDWLRRSIALGNSNKFWFEHDPNLQSLREDARFAEMIESM